MNLKVNDFVEFEIGNSIQKNLPRWWHGKDTGSTGIWAKGRVQSIDNKKIIVAYIIESYIGTGFCEWDNLNTTPDILQRLYPGYLRKINIKCDCGANTVYGSSNDAHSDWCSTSKFRINT